MKRNALLLGLCLCACTELQNRQSSDSTALDTSFSRYSEQFIEDLWFHFPEWATQMGYHLHNDTLMIPDSSYRVKLLQFVDRHLDSLQQYQAGKLSTSLRIDQQLIQNHLEQLQWRITEKKDYAWDAVSYNLPLLIAYMLHENYAPLPERLAQIKNRLKYAEAYYQAAQNNLSEAVPELARMSAQQHQGGLPILRQDLSDSVNRSNLDEAEKTEILKLAKQAEAAVAGFIAFLEQEIPLNKRSFRLGKELYEKQFEFEIQSEKKAEELYQLALKRKAHLHDKMHEIVLKLWPKYFGNDAPPEERLVAIRTMIDTLSVNHARPEDFQKEIEEQLPELTKFVNEKNLLYLDPSKPLVVRKEPAYQAGLAGASINAPGPYDTLGNTYYNVGSLHGWSPERAQSYLREYNDYILQILNIHEAIPGHYTQLVYANKSKSIIKSILANGAMIEGWAVYTEQMMLEEGYGNDEPEMWLMWYKWNLRTVCNTILDYAVHVEGMNREEALDLLINQAFQQTAEAQGKWHRVTVSSVQLTSYFAGYTEIIGLREELQKKQGSEFSLKKFHENFLSYGNAPVKDIRKLMLDELEGKAE